MRMNWVLRDTNTFYCYFKKEKLLGLYYRAGYENRGTITDEYN
jgi:hypothetical protein